MPHIYLANSSCGIACFRGCKIWLICRFWIWTPRREWKWAGKEGALASQAIYRGSQSPWKYFFLKCNLVASISYGIILNSKKIVNRYSSGKPGRNLFFVSTRPLIICFLKFILFIDWGGSLRLPPPFTKNKSSHVRSQKFGKKPSCMHCIVFESLKFEHDVSFEFRQHEGKRSRVKLKLW